MIRRTRLVMACALSVVALAGAVRVRHWLAIDTCLDAGGAWDHAAGECQPR